MSSSIRGIGKQLSILWVGDRYPPGSGRARWQTLVNAGHYVEDLSYDQAVRDYPRMLSRIEAKLLNGPGILRFNRLIRQRVRQRHFDWVWVDGGWAVYVGTLKKLRSMGLFLIHGANDDLMDPRGHYARCVAAVRDYHVHVTPYVDVAKDLGDMGVEHVIQSRFGYEPPYCLPGGKRAAPDPKYTADVIFVGHWERDRDRFILPLVEAGINVKVWGPRWERSPNRQRYGNSVTYRMLGYPEYAIAIASARIGLGLISKLSRNRSTTRIFEIPAVGTFMLAERTEECREAFEEGKEAQFFDSPEELLEKVRFYLSHDDARKRIAEAGNRRALTSGYSYYDRMETDVAKIMSIFESLSGTGKLREQVCRT